MTDVPPETPSDPSDEHPEPVAVAAFTDRGEAEVALAKLRAYGIEGIIADDAEGGALPVEGDLTVVVVVREADADEARELLAADEQAIEAAAEETDI